MNRLKGNLKSGLKHLIKSYRILEYSHRDFNLLLQDARSYIDQITAEIAARGIQ